jgi:hypothetical protein
LQSRVVVSVLACALVLIALGCSRPVQQSTAPATAPPAAGPATGPGEISTAPPAVEPSATPVVTSGPVTKPAERSAEGKAILDAARRRLKTSGRFFVQQLLVQGDVALAVLSIEGSPKGARILALERRGGSWRAVWDAELLGSSASSVRVAVPIVTAELVGKLRFDLPQSLDQDQTALLFGAIKAAVAAAKAQGGSAVGSLTVDSSRLAQDGKGTWWASVVVKPSKAGMESLPVFLHRVGTAWKVVDLGTGIEPSSDSRFPAEVRDKL